MPALMNGKEVVDLFLREELGDRRQRALLDEERELEGVDRGAVGRAAGARLLEHAGMLAADVGREILDVDLPVGVGLRELGEELLEALRLAGRRAGVREGRVGAKGHRLRRIGQADAVGGQKLLSASAGGQAAQHRRRKKQTENRAATFHPFLPLSAVNLRRARLVIVRALRRSL